jgi:hypothetical protein
MPDDAAELMAQFAERTGLTGAHPPRRYLWTDAFAVCNFLGSYRETGDPQPLALARTLVDQVHRTLGRHRSDDQRTGWISGLSEQDGERHPTLGGLRIGKPHPERASGQPLDERAEWDRDGQYFHYLTKWMHALDQLARATSDPTYATWARELADTAHRRFVYGDRALRMYWKMSIDLSRPLVTSMGHHDPLDGFLTCAQLAATPAPGPDLADARRDFAQMIQRRSLATEDPLGIGGLLVDALRAVSLRVERPLVEAIVAGAELGLRHYVDDPDLHAPAARRLGFRELGLAIGLAAVQREPTLSARFAPFQPLRDELTAFWLRPDHRQTRAWTEHADINDVMLATSLAPAGYLTLPTVTPR